MRLGLQHETHGTLSWMLGAIRGTAPDIRPFYDLRGQVPEQEAELGLPGYRGSQPVLEGNQAVDQPQWGNFGDLLECVWLAVERDSAVLDPVTGRMLERIAERVCDVWTKPGLGYLGTRDPAALHDLQDGLLGGPGPDGPARRTRPGGRARRRARWRAEASAIRDWVNVRCWSEAKRSYTFYAGSDDLDASVLLAGRMGFVPGDSPRFSQTIDAVRDELADGPLIYRYSGSREQEGAFLACSFWLIDALVRAGRHEQAREIWKGMAPYAGDLGLLSEEFDPASGELRGNLPQALPPGPSHGRPPARRLPGTALGT